MPNFKDINPLGHQLNWQTMTQALGQDLNEDEIHIWHIPLYLNESQKKIALDLLNSTQMDRYHRRMTDELKSSYLAGRFYLMTLLAQYSGLEADEVNLEYSRLSKPFLHPNPDCIQFNFTDTTFNGEPTGIFAFARNVDIGVDIEAVNRTSQFSAIAAKRLSANEQSYVNDGNRISAGRFLAIWTRKEAYGKAIGQGINFKMRETDLYGKGGHTLNFYDPKKNAYRLNQFTIGQKFVACVVHSSHQPLRIRAFSLENQMP